MSEDDTEFEFVEENATPYWTSDALLKALDVAFKTQLTADSPKAEQPTEIQVPLRDHQKALLYAMEKREMESQKGIEWNGSRTFVNYGVLGDEVGTGKSLVVLSHIAKMKYATKTHKQRMLASASTTNFFTIYTKRYSNEHKPSLIVVPHTIYRQWQNYCKKQTSLNIFYAKTHKDIEALSYYVDISGNNNAKQKLVDTIKTSDAVLVSNTLYATLQAGAIINSIDWNRAFVDEADTIHITNSSRRLYNTPFVWFITATWPNFILNGCCIRPLLLEYYNTHSSTYTPELGQWLKNEIGEPTTMAGGRTTWLRLRSQGWLKSYETTHSYRAIVLLTCSAEFLSASRQMPLIQEQTIVCQAPASFAAVSSLVNPRIQSMLHAGNVEGALQELGISSDTSMNLVEAVTKEREKELDRLRKTLAFKQTIDYATEAAKQQAIQSLESKIKSVEEQLSTFKERLSASTTTEECPICYDDPNQNSATLTPCCHRIFCGVCILRSLTRGMTCPMCRASIQLSSLTQLVPETKKKKKEAPKTYLSKPKQLLKFLKENPTASVLVFSRYENPFISLEYDCEEAGISYHTLRGNKDVIASTIKSFEEGNKRVLFLPTQTMGAGLNLLSATHVILLHAMTPEEEKQAIGRAYRLGRTEPLNVVKLRHEGETLLSF
jgi:SNF2 family DNA or RNA helicase